VRRPLCQERATITASGVFFAYGSLEGLLLILRTLGDDRPGRWGSSFAVKPLDWQGSSLFVHRIGTGHIGGEAKAVAELTRMLTALLSAREGRGGACSHSPGIPDPTVPLDIHREAREHQ
jgi:hypothetical protein